MTVSAAGYTEVPAVGFRQRLDDRQSDARTAVIAVPRAESAR